MLSWIVRRLAPPRLTPALTLVLGDLVDQDVDAVVNAADETLLGGTGVDGALHAAAGPELGRACAALGGCPTGGVRVTPGFRLKARHVIHTVAPVWDSGAPDAVQAANAEALGHCYTAVARAADRLGLASLAVPSLGAGAFGWPVAEVAGIAAAALRGLRTRHLREVRFVAFSRPAFAAHQRALGVSGTVERDPESLRYHAGASALGGVARDL